MFLTPIFFCHGLKVLLKLAFYQTNSLHQVTNTLLQYYYCYWNVFKWCKVKSALHEIESSIILVSEDNKMRQLFDLLTIPFKGRILNCLKCWRKFFSHLLCNVPSEYHHFCEKTPKCLLQQLILANFILSNRGSTYGPAIINDIFVMPCLWYWFSVKSTRILIHFSKFCFYFRRIRRKQRIVYDAKLSIIIAIIQVM